MVVQSEVHKYNIASIDNLKLHIRQKKKIAWSGKIFSHKTSILSPDFWRCLTSDLGRVKNCRCSAAPAAAPWRCSLPSLPPSRSPSHQVSTCVVRTAHAGPTWNIFPGAHGPRLHTSEWIFIYNAGLRKQLVNPFSLRPLICSYLLQQPKKSRGIFSSLLPIDLALRKSALLSKHYWSLPPLNDRLSHQCIKGLDELKFHFRQLVPVIFTLFQ